MFILFQLCFSRVKLFHVSDERSNVFDMPLMNIVGSNFDMLDVPNLVFS